jgi:signal transduction histidine kinase
MVRLLRTNAFRLAAIYFGLFAVSVSALLVFIYFSTADFIERQTEVTIDAEITGLREQYGERGLAGLIEIIRGRVAAQHSDTALYLITDAALQPLAGNISGWPGAVPSRPARISFPLHSKGADGEASDTALAAVFPLSGGYLLLVGRDLHDAQVFRSRITQTLSWAALLTLALGVAGGLFMTRNMLRRVEAVNRTSARIIHGDLSQRVPLTGSGDEFDQLAGNLNAMLDQIERLMAGMRQVTDNIAHDLRTPLARLRARLEVTLLERPDVTRYGEALRETITEADRLLGTFNALLSIAEAEAGSRRQTMAVVDVAEIARAVAELYEPAAEEKGLRLDVANGGALPVRGDRHLLSQAIANLLDNALKYTPVGAVSLTTRESTEGARIEVADRGPGVPADRREAVFDRFVRLESSRSTPGNGLGLSLVRAVATLHGGAAWLEDNNPGVRAIITLPRAEAPALASTRNAA